MKGMDLVALSTGPGGEVALASSAGDAGIRRLAPLPFERQAAALAERGEFAAALELAALVPPERVRAARTGSDVPPGAARHRAPMLRLTFLAPSGRCLHRQTHHLL